MVLAILTGVDYDSAYPDMHRYQKKLKTAIVATLPLLFSACLFEVRFNALTLTTRYHVGSVFSVNNIPIEVKAFPTGVSGSNEYAEVQDGYGMPGIGQDIWTRRVGLAPQFGYPLNKVGVLCLAYGIQHYFEVNGEVTYFRKTETLPDQTVAGVTVTDVTQSQNVSRRITLITLTGPITSFAIGGDELAVSYIKGWNESCM
jgi:hypothetical protein